VKEKQKDNGLPKGDARKDGQHAANGYGSGVPGHLKNGCAERSEASKSKDCESGKSNCPKRRSNDVQESIFPAFLMTKFATQ
jgi:hypothetical protein